MDNEWMFTDLAEQAYGMLPVSNLSGKGSSSLRFYEQLTSYNWSRQYPDERVLVIPGGPHELIPTWQGGQLEPDSDPMLFDPNHLFWPEGPLDPIFRAVQHSVDQGDIDAVNYQDFDVVIDVMNLQKLFAFCKGGEDEGIFRIDIERVGKLVMFNRKEASDWMMADFVNFDMNMRKVCTKPHAEAYEGPFQQVAKYQFGQLKLLVRFDAHAGDYSKASGKSKKKKGAAASEEKPPEEGDTTSSEPPGPKPFGPDTELKFVTSPLARKNHLLITTNYPSGKGFPYYTYPQMFFSGTETMLCGWYKNVGDFTKPASYALGDINKLMKPLPYATLAKVHDLLNKLVSFTRKCASDAKVAIIWLNEPQLAIYERLPESPSAITDPVRAMLQAGVNEADEEPDQDGAESGGGK